ncbi:MAG: hypothetical protein MJ160_01200 [Treponema sp.]|nr:hypothetical protein [Treponema sp.]
MKKLFLFLSLCTTLLFSSCSNFFAPFNENGRIVISFSNKDAAKSIYTNISDIPINRGAIPIRIDITHETTGESESQEITINALQEYSNSTVTFENVRIGTWTVSCYALDKNDNGDTLDEIAFAQERVTVEAGDTKPVNLTPLYNIVSPSIGVNVSSLKLIKAPSKTSYVLDDPLQADDAIFEIELSNGYKTEMTFQKIQSTFADSLSSFTINVSFAIEPNETPVYDVNQATRFYYYILYTYGNTDTHGAYEPNYISVPITLSAKPPVITEQPGIATMDKQKTYEFSVEAQLPTYDVPANNTTSSAELRYYWHSAGSSITPNEINKASADGSILRETGSIFGDQLYFDYNQCAVINADTDGLNGEPSFVESRYGTLERRVPGAGATNQQFRMNDTNISLTNENNKEFFISEYKNGHWTVPSIEMFRIEKTFYNLGKGDTGTGYYYDFTESNNKYNITVERVNTSDLPIFGYVPYKVSYSFEEDNITWEQNRYNDSAERYKIIYVPTKLASVPDVSFEYADGNYTNNQYNYCERYYNFVDKKYYGYKYGTTRNPLPDPKPAEVAVNSFSIKGYYYGNETENYKKVDLISCKGIRNGWSEDMSLNKKGESLELCTLSDNQSYFITEFQEQDCLTRVPSVNFYISLEAYFSVSDKYKEWVIDKTPVHKSLPAVKFSLDTN